MKKILNSIQPVVKKSKFVRINETAIADFTKTITSGDFNKSEYNSETIIENGSEEEQIAHAIVYNALNFCYWGEPKWTITIDNQEYDGSFGMLRALKRGIRNGHKLLKAEYLAKLPKQDLKDVFKGNTVIPLFKERLEFLRELGKIIVGKFNGQFLNVVKKGNFDSEEIVNVLSGDFPDIFNDTAIYHGNKVYFYKRAQLVPAHLVDLKKLDLISSDITGYDHLTAFADYKVPQLLRKFGILEYAKELANRIDDKIEIPSGSDEEIEIRANTIWAVELATRVLKKNFPQANAAKVDGIFWFRGQKKSPDDKPYHRTKTIWY